MPKKEAIVERLFRGIPVSEGIAIGRVMVLESPWDAVVDLSIRKNKVPEEKERYTQALKAVSQQLIECRDRIQKEIGREEAKIFDAHLTILNDPFFQNEIPAAIGQRLKNADFLLKEGIERLNQSFLKLKNDRFRIRIDDIKDVTVRILRVLLRTEDLGVSVKCPVVLVSHNLVPSDIARFERKQILGCATELGGKMSHTSILARSMGIPAVVGVEKLMKSVVSRKTIIIDGNSGIVIVDPPTVVLNGYKKSQKQFAHYWHRLYEKSSQPSVTTDGEVVSLQANITLTADVGMAVQYHADGIGLYRTELPFMIAERLLNEDEQLAIYRMVVESMAGKPVTIRTLDLGGDKFLPFQEVTKEHNPFLGWRSIRIFLQEKDIFKTQLRAILKASVSGNVKILFPMISSLEEILEIRDVVEETKKDLDRAGIPYDRNIKTGVMIEIPSAAILSDQLARHTDFFSIGTNDLVQYTLAVDRNNEKVARFYQPLNPAVLRLIRTTVESADRNHIPVSICGEMAGNPIYTPMLLGFGLQTLSMSPMMLPEVKERVRVLSMDDCRKIAREVLELDTAERVENVLAEWHRTLNLKQSVPYMEKSDYTSPWHSKRS